MNIDAESIALLSLILRDAPQDRQFILCVLARSNQVPGQIKFHSNTEYPTFYGYSNERMPFFLMGKGVLSNVPREGFAKRLISSHYLSYAETVINNAKNWDIHQKLMSVSKFITLDNKTGYKDAEVFLVFRDKAQDYIKDYLSQNHGQISGFLKSKVGRFEFGSQLLKQNEKIREEKGVDLRTRYDQLLEEIRQSKRQASKSSVIPQRNNSNSFNLIDNVLSINGKRIEFRKDTRKLALLKLLVKKQKGIYYSEVAEKLEGVVTDETKSTKNICYEACRGLENSLAKISITNFLQFDYNQAKINPLYKRAS